MPSTKSATHATLSAERAEAFAASIRAGRSRAKLTQEELAHRAGITVVHVRRLERGTSNPTLATLCAVADALGVQPSKLVPR